MAKARNGEEAVRRLLAGIELDAGPARFKRLEPSQTRKDSGANRWYRAVLAERRDREVRRMVEAAGARVSRLMRVRFGPISPRLDLPPGRCVEVDAGKTQNLIQAVRLRARGRQCRIRRPANTTGPQSTQASLVKEVC